jgi:hypothetical protein
MPLDNALLLHLYDLTNKSHAESCLSLSSTMYEGQ